VRIRTSAVKPLRSVAVEAVRCGQGTHRSLQKAARRVRDRISNTEQLLSDLHMAVDALEKRLDTIPRRCLRPARLGQALFRRSRNRIFRDDSTS